MMKIGFCAGLDRLNILERAGIDNIELSVAQVMGYTEDERERYLTQLKASPVRFESVNCLIGGFSLYDDCRDGFMKTRAWFAEIFPVLARFGVRTLVFGSGGYRKVPDGMSRDDAKVQILTFLRLLSECCMPYGFTAVVEPLPYRSCNIINSLPEGAAYVRELNLPNIRLLVDFWHFLYEGERLDIIRDYGDILAHVHIANPVHGHVPAPYDGFDVRGCVEALKAAGYTGVIVAEAKVPGDFEEGVRGYREVMMKAFSEVLV